MKTKSFIMLVVGMVLGGAALGGAFLGGQAVGKNSAQATLPQSVQGRGGQFGANAGQFAVNGTPPQGGIPQGNRIAGGPGTAFIGGVAGKVQNVAGNTVTLTTQNGSTMQIVLGANTTVQKLTQGTAGDITAGSNITVSGPRNTDGSVQAATVLIAY